MLESASSIDEVARDDSGASGRSDGFRERLIAYKDLSKIEIFDPYLSVALVWSLLPSSEVGSTTTIVVLGLLLVGMIGIVTAEGALDDVAGMRDGIDTVNYDEGELQRKRKRKPLLDQRLTEREALRYGYGAATVGVLAGMGAFVAAGFEPWWAPIAVIGFLLLVVGYSWGLKLSYHGGQEVVVVGGISGGMVLMYAMLSDGALAWEPAVQGFVVGVLLMLPASYANYHDREGDAQADRKTMAVRASESGYRRYLLGFAGLGWAGLVAGIATGLLPLWLPLLLIPAIVMHVQGLRAALVEGDYLKARAGGFPVFRLAVLGFLVANLIQM